MNTTTPEQIENLVIEPLNNSHKRANFQCGITSLDEYIKKQARQDVKRRVSKVFVAVEQTSPDDIIGYYTLSTLSIDISQLPEALARKLPKHPIPAALIGRLAVSEHAQSYGVGKMLLTDALKRTLYVGNEIAIYALVVDAISERAESFYQQFGFDKLSAGGRRLFLPLRSV